MKDYQKLLFAIIFISGNIGFFWFSQGTPPEKNTLVHTPSTLINWEKGSSQIYDVSMDSSMNLDSLAAGTGTGGKQNMKVHMRSKLQLRTLEAEKNKALVGMQLSDLRLSVSGQSDSELNRVLETPFRVHFLSGGVAEKFDFPEGLTAQEQTMLESIVRTFTISIPENNANNNTQWVSKEKNAQGSYEAIYQHLNTKKIEKSKRKFVALTSSPMLRTASITSEESIELNKNNWINSMTINESLKTPDNQSPSINIVNQAKIKLVDNLHSKHPQELWNFVASAPIPETINNSNLKLSPKEAQQQLVASLPTLDSTHQGRTKLIHQLRDLLRVDASVATTLLEQMKTQELTDRTRADLYLALELAATPEAQSALTSVISNPDWSARDALRATVALAGIDNPSPETLAILWDTAYAERPQISSTATFTLGSMASRMKDSNHPDYQNLRDDLLSSAYSSSNTQEKATFIYALGNTRDSDLAENVTTFLNDDQPAIRQATALSLGLMQSENSADILVEHFKVETNSAVKGAIAESLVSLPIADSSSAMNTIGKAIQIEESEKARLSMANFMGKNLAQHPEYKTILQNLIREEPSKRVRQVFANALATL